MQSSLFWLTNGRGKFTGVLENRLVPVLFGLILLAFPVITAQADELCELLCEDEFAKCENP